MIMATFRLGPGSILVLSRGDLTTWTGRDGAIVNAANECMLGGGGVDGAIHRRAGTKLKQMCKKIKEVERGVRCPTGTAQITSGKTGLPVEHVIHTVGPRYENDTVSSPLLEGAYRSSLELANHHNVKTIAFPAISCGAYGYPHDKAAEIALDQCEKHAGSLEEVHFLLFEEEAWDAWRTEAEGRFKHLDDGAGTD